MSALRAFVERIERLETEIDELNSDKRDVYAEAKGNGFDVKALKAVIAHRRKDPTERDELTAIVETYLAELERGTVVATRVRAHEKKPDPGGAIDPRRTGAATDKISDSRQGIATSSFEMPDIPDYLRRTA